MPVSPQRIPLLTPSLVLLCVALLGGCAPDADALGQRLRADAAAVLLQMQDLHDMRGIRVEDDGTRPESCPDGTHHRWAASGVISEEYSDLDDRLDTLRAQAYGVVPEVTAVDGEDTYEGEITAGDDVDDLAGRVDRWRSTDENITLQVELVTTPEGPIQLIVSGETVCR